MELKIKSRKLDREFTFFFSGYYIYVNTNGKAGTLGEQPCKGGYVNSGSTLTATEETFEKVCRNWLRQYIANASEFPQGEF